MHGKKKERQKIKKKNKSKKFSLKKMPSQAVVHVQYKIGTNQKQQLWHVNAHELRLLIKTMLMRMGAEPSPNDLLTVLEVFFPSQSNKALEQIRAEPNSTDFFDKLSEKIIHELVHTEKLHLKQNAKCDFFKNWWRSKTPAGQVVCLLEGIIEDAKNEKKQKIDTIINGLYIEHSSLYPGSKEPDEQAVKNYIAKQDMAL